MSLLFFILEFFCIEIVAEIISPVDIRHKATRTSEYVTEQGDTVKKSYETTVELQ